MCCLPMDRAICRRPLNGFAFAPATVLAPVLAAATVTLLELEADVLAAVAMLAAFDAAATLRSTIAFGFLVGLGHARLVHVDLQLNHRGSPPIHTGCNEESGGNRAAAPFHSADRCYGPMCCFSQPLTVSCHCTLFCGFSTQWFSSGKYRNFDSTPLRCKAVNKAMPCSTGMRKSCWP